MFLTCEIAKSYRPNDRFWPKAALRFSRFSAV
jgi:hypothetical protein